MATQIKFGTSGWRAIVAEEFTFANVRRAIHGIARYVVSQKPSGARVIVGRDPRFLGETFCAIAAEILASYGITPLVIAEAVPTPAISYAVIKEKADGAINFTASHNPPEYNGIKFSTPDGAPALPEATKRIEAEIEAYDKDQSSGPQKNPPAAQPLEPRAMYLARLKEIVNFPAIKKAGLRIGLIPSGEPPVDTPTHCSAIMVSTFSPFTTSATYFLEATPPNPMTICSRNSAPR